MKALCDRFLPQQSSSSSKSETHDSSPTSLVSDSGPRDNKSKFPIWSNVFKPSSSVSQPYRESSTFGHKQVCTTCNNGWTAFVKGASMAGDAIRKFQERVLGPSRTGLPNNTSDVWLLGVCYRISEDEASGDKDNGSVLAALNQDFSSKILMTYRKGFTPFVDTTYTSDVNWGCMIRSSQMLFAQALLFHRLRRSWTKTSGSILPPRVETSSLFHLKVQPPEQEYLEILELFGDSEASAFSVHNLILAGKSYGLAVGSWVGPYAICRSWESLVCKRRKQTDSKIQMLPMAVHVVSGSEDGERGGAPILCIEDVTKSCLEFSKGQTEWTPVLLLVPLVLGLDRVNPRYIPSIIATFTFPQSVGILGGKPGTSTYIVGVQEDKGFYLDPHDVQPVVRVNKETPDVDTSSYHSNVLRYVPLESLDPSLALGFYCRKKDDFDAFCLRALKLAEESNGAPLFTITKTHRSISHNNYEFTENKDNEREDDWQLL